MLGGFDGGQVAEDDGALLVACDRSILQDAEQGVPGLGQVPGFEPGVALERGQPDG
ncbi:MAG: hypothetical protein ACRDPY_43035 [Streptosporangiaceae bacterium]